MMLNSSGKIRQVDLKKQNILFLDLQTTGAKPGSANILEIAWTTLHSEKIESHLVKQPEEQSIPRRIQFITGINDADMGQAKDLFEILQSLKEYVETSLGPKAFAIIHFAQFEKPFLSDAYEKIQKEMPFSILCTHEIAKRLLPNLPTRGIKGLAGYFGFPSGELKRAANHVQATQIIWQGLTSILAEQNIHTLDELNQWILDTPKGTRAKYEYPLPKEKRLSLPKEPGIYRMISKWGEVLYVGKATSLHDRVNSYFRGQKNRDSRKLEMLTQVWDLQVTIVGSPLEAALLETDEIKRLDPPYNVSLKTGHRCMAFFNRDFTSVNDKCDQEHLIGPFSNSLALDSMIRLSQSIRSGVLDENMFFEPLNPSLLEEGFKIFCCRHNLNSLCFSSMRSILAIGLNWVRKLKDEEVDLDLGEKEKKFVDKVEAGNIDGNDISATAEAKSQHVTISILDCNYNDGVITTDAIELEPEDIADKFERHFIRAAKAYLRTKKLSQLLNADIQFKTKNKVKPTTVLKIRQGQIIPANCSQQNLGSWENLSIDTYDRMTVLYTEIEKLNSKKNFIKITRLLPCQKQFSNLINDKQI